MSAGDPNEPADLNTLAGLAEAIVAAPPRCGPVRVVAIDGGAAAGKSSLAAALAGRLPDTAVLHLDDLLDGWTGQFSYADRLQAEVLAPLSDGRPAQLRRYDWTAGRFTTPVLFAVPDTLIVEGVSAIDGCGRWRSVGIYLDLPRAVRERRWIERDGPVQPQWLDWLDAEDRYFAEHQLPADTIVIDR